MAEAGADFSPSLWWPSMKSLSKLFLHFTSSLIHAFKLLFPFRRCHPPQPLPLEADRISDVLRRKHEFLQEYKEDYGYPNGSMPIDELRAKEFSHLKGTVYLDHAGATLYASSQIHAAFKDLSNNLYGNPHSQSYSSETSSNIVAAARDEVLRFFNAPEEKYSCIFTSGATASLKLVGETFPWSPSSRYLYTSENHNSVVGIREYALAEGATAAAIGFEHLQAYLSHDSLEIKDLCLKSRMLQRQIVRVVDHEQNGPICSLFAIPLECNFSGVKFNLESVKCFQDGKNLNNSREKWLVLLDAAKGSGTSPPDLSTYPFDFVAVSFYKIFGYPTGLGALLVRKDASKLLRKRYFGGGTVSLSVADADIVQRRDNVEQWLEDGTLSFLSIAALSHGFAMIKQLGLSSIERHVETLTSFTVSKLASLRHCNGSPVSVIYGKHINANHHQGSIVAFNLMRSDGSMIGYREVEKLAELNNIHLRTGCFCNPGACAKYLKLSHEDLQANFEAGHVCWDDNDIIFGKPTGAVRVSFGYMSTIEDSLTLIDFICKFFVENNPRQKDASYSKQASSPEYNIKMKGDLTNMNTMTLDSIFIYPIKSCAGFSVDAWPIGDSGLLFDREWLIKSTLGDVLTQKKYPQMCLIKAFIDLSSQKLHVTSPNMTEKIDISLEECLQYHHESSLQFCGQRPDGQFYGKEIEKWFTEALGLSCNLIRKEPRSRQVLSRISRHLQKGVQLDRRESFANEGMCLGRRELSFANEGQYLLVSRTSIDDLNQRLASTAQNGEETLQVDAMRFRPNFVISGGLPYEEDQWRALSIGSEKFHVLGGCNRCQMINIDPTTGNIQNANFPLLALASYRRIRGRILFGILLVHDASMHVSDNATSSGRCSKILQVGLSVSPVET